MSQNSHQQHLQRLEGQRRFLIWAGVPLCVASLILVVTLFFGVVPFEPVAVGVAFALSLGSLGIILAINKVKQQAKSILIPQSISSIPGISLAEYLPDLTPQSRRIASVQDIFQKYNHHKRLDTIDDYLSFQYKHCPVELMDGSLSYTVSTGKSSRRVTEHYLILKTVFPDTVEGTTALVNADFLNSSWRFGLPHKIATESIELNRLFRIRATDQVSARMHLQPNIMADILDLYQHHHYQNIVYYFENSSLTVIMKEDAGSFEPNMLRSLLSTSQLSGISEDVKRCLHIFDTMWLDLRAQKITTD